MITIITTTLLFLLMLFCLFMTIRILRVYNYLTEMLKKISIRNKKDIQDNKYWEWRWITFEKITFGEMVWKFWRPLSSFYDEEKLLK